LLPYLKGDDLLSIPREHSFDQSHWRNLVGRWPWLLPAGSAIALIVGNGPISVFAFGVFIKPLEAEFGWSRASISAGLSLCGLFSAITLPFVGGLMDRHGVRRPLVIAVCLFALNIAAIGGATTLAMFIALTALSGLTGAAQSPLAYIKTISNHFDSRRGLAIGIAMSGIGIGTAFVPLFAQSLINSFGWRAAYMGLGALILLLALPVVSAVIQDGPARPAIPGEGVDVAKGTSVRAALGSRVFWCLALGVVLASLALNGSLVHVVPMLTERGWTPDRAAAALTAAGLAGMTGRIVVGFLIDRMFAPYVGGAFFLLAAAGMVVLIEDKAVILGVVTVGLAVGAEIDMMGYLVSRYFGFSALGKIYGMIFALFTIAAGLGPYLMGLSFTSTKAYDVGFSAAAVLLLVAGLVIMTLGPYRYKLGSATMAEAGH
jgi:MFS family permease